MQPLSAKVEYRRWFDGTLSAGAQDGTRQVCLIFSFTPLTLSDLSYRRLENTLPGRDGYDIEIFGMEGVPTKAQAEWRARKEAEAGVAGRVNAATSQGAKRPRIYKGIISEVDLAGLLAQHKALMSGQMKSFMPPPGMPPMMGMPPPTFAGGMPMGMPPFMPPNGMPQ